MPHFDGDDILLLRSNVDRYITSAAPGSIATETAWRDFAELGWLGIAIEEEYGGLGAGAEAVGEIARGVGRGLLKLPYLSSAVMAPAILQVAGSTEQKAAILPEIAAGKAIAALALREPGGGFDGAVSGAVAVRDGSGYRIRGQKQFVLDASLADFLLIGARIADGDGPLAVFIVKKSDTGVEFQQYRALDGRAVADVSFSDTYVDGGRLLPGSPAIAIELANSLGVLTLCSEDCAIAGELNRLTLDYLKTRKQFGRPIGTFQVLQHRMVEMTLLEQQMSTLTRHAQRLFDRPLSTSQNWASASRAIVSGGARKIAEASIQLHGGIGMSDELMVGHYLKRVLTNMSLLGDQTWHLDKLAHLLKIGSGAQAGAGENRMALCA